MVPDRTILHLVEKKIQAGGRPRPTPVQNYGVHTIKPQLRPWRQFWTNHTIFIRPKKLDFES